MQIRSAYLLLAEVDDLFLRLTGIDYTDRLGDGLMARHLSVTHRKQEWVSYRGSDGMVTSDHHDADAGLVEALNGGGHRGARGVHEREQADKGELVLRPY